MPTIKIAHLYYDLMNLYGENGNIRFLAYKLEEQNVKTEIHFLTIGDEIDFNAYDFFYCGTGSEENEALILKDLLKYKKDIKKAIDDHKFFLTTGNSYPLFGHQKETINGEIIDCLSIFPYYSKEEEFRLIGEKKYHCSLINKTIIGFENRSSVITNIEQNLFSSDDKKVKREIKNEGYQDQNFYGTFLLGPILVRNPYLCDFIVKKLLEEKNIPYQKPNTDDYCYKAYEEYLKNFPLK